MPNTKDKNPEVAAFEAALLRSVDQAISGQLGRVHAPEQIAARRRSYGFKKKRPSAQWIPAVLAINNGAILASATAGRWRGRSQDRTSASSSGWRSSTFSSLTSANGGLVLPVS